MQCITPCARTCRPPQAKGYFEMFKDLSAQLCSITGFDAMSLQPNSGASGEYAGLMAIRGYHQVRRACACTLATLCFPDRWVGDCE